jgi:hypothetical protein
MDFPVADRLRRNGPHPRAFKFGQARLKNALGGAIEFNQFLDAGRP